MARSVLVWWPSRAAVVEGDPFFLRSDASSRLSHNAKRGHPVASGDSLPLRLCALMSVYYSVLLPSIFLKPAPHDEDSSSSDEEDIRKSPCEKNQLAIDIYL